MSEGDVSLIRDEDVLRRMWQQTEDFSRKKEIRAHMYRLREERLRNLYSPEPTLDAKGCEFTSPQGHVNSFADQTFQSMKSKEVRDAGSPPKEFTYRGQDLKELSNAGWNVESENRTTDDGHTHVKTVQANIEGRYDVEGGKGQFAAIDQHKQAVTEYQDDNTSLKRNESSTNTAAHEQVVRQTDDGSHFSSTTSSSSSTSKFQQSSSTRHESVPYVTNQDYDLSRNKQTDNRNVEETSTRHVTKSSDYEQSLRRSDFEQGELVSRKVDYPDDNTKVIVETRCLPDGTRVTSTRREFRVPAVHSSRSEQHSQQSRSESKSFHTTSQQRSNTKESSSKIVRENIDNRTENIVDSQRNVDDYDFKRNQDIHYTTNKKDDYTHTQTTDRHDTERQNVVKLDDSNRLYYTTNKKDDFSQTTDRRDIERQNVVKVDDSNRREVITSQDNQNVCRQDTNEIRYVKGTKEKIHNIVKDTKVEEVVEKKTSSNQYQTTYTSDYTQRKISNDLSPTHQAWASTLRGDTPTTTRPSTRASSPGSRTFKSSTSSLRSSVSPDKTYRKPSSRGGSPNKADKHSPTRTISDRYSSTIHSTSSVTQTKTDKHTSPDRKYPHERSPTRPSSTPDKKSPVHRQRPSVSPEKRPQDLTYRPSTSPERKPEHKPTPTEDYPRTVSPLKPTDRDVSPSKQTDRNIIPTRPVDRDGSPRKPIDRESTLTRPLEKDESPMRTTDRDGSPKRPVEDERTDRKPTDTDKYPMNFSPDRKPGCQPSEVKTHPEPSYPSPNQFRVSPEKEYPNETFSTRPSQSPDRKPRSGQPTPASDYPRTTSPTRPSHTEHRPSLSPNRKPGYDQPSSPSKGKPEKTPADKYPKQSSPTRPSVSPDRKPGYMRPTAASTSSPAPEGPRTSPTRPYTSPERKSPTKHLPTQSPERKPYNKTTTTSKIQEDHYKFVEEETKMYSRTDRKDVDSVKQRPLPSPDKYTTRHEKSPSPIRKSPTKDAPDRYATSPTRKSPTKDASDRYATSPTRKSPTKDVPDRYATSPTRKSPTKDVPDRYATSPTRKSPTKDAPDRYATSPTRKSPTKDLLDRYATSPTRKSPTKDVPDRYATFPTRKSPTKDVPDHRIPSPSRKSPTKEVSDYRVRSPARKSPTKDTPDHRFPSPTRKLPAKEVPDYYISSPTRKSPAKETTEHRVSSPARKSPTKDVPDYYVTSPSRKSPAADTPDYCQPTQRKSSRSPSPKGPVTFQDHLDDKRYERVETTEDIKSTKTDVSNKFDTYTRSDVKEYHKIRDRDSVSPTKNDVPDREPSPSNYGTYDKKQRRTEEVEEITIVDTKDSEDVKYDSLTRREKTSFPKKMHEQPDETIKKTPRDTVSPLKSPSKDTKYKLTTDFITTEKITEETNKKLTTKDHPRQLVTPSTSPTRKPKPVEKEQSTSPTRKPKPVEMEPSTGQSSPTTSVSGFVYFSSPRTEKTVVTDLDDQEYYTKIDNTEEVTTTHKRPENLDVKRSPSPSKIPCKSPPPDRRVSPTKESLPRKSSLKKPSSDTNQTSPIEKPPSSFRVSPDVEYREIPEHKIFKKDRPLGQETDSPIKPKPPLERRETYEERCRKILGMVDDDSTTKTITTETTIHKGKPDSNLSSPSVSPCTSPIQKEASPFRDHPVKKETVESKTRVTDFITREQDDTLKKATTTTTIRNNITTDRKSTTPSRDSSPTKLQDIISQPKYATNEDITSTQHIEEDTIIISKTVDNKHPSTRPSMSPTRKTPEQTSGIPTRSTPKKPEGPKLARTPSPTKKVTKVTEENTELITSEREQEILDRVQKSLRRLSPERNERSPSREKSPDKTTTSLLDIDITTATVKTNKVTNEDVRKTTEKQTTTKDIIRPGKLKDDKPQEEKTPSKTPSRNVSPTKKPTGIASPSKVDKSPESPTKSRSISPRKPVSSTERPQSPQLSKTSGIKPREPVPSHLTRKPTPTTTSLTKTEKTFTTDIKKTSGVTKQNSFTKTTTTKTTTNKFNQSPTRKPTEPEQKRAPTPKGLKENVSPKKDTDTKVTRTPSDSSMKPKKTSPQRIKSKPEIQVSDLSTSKTSKLTTSTTKTQKSSIKEPQPKLASKPKSATALNTSTDDDDVIIDVQQAKSSRENSPDNICPTPISFLDDVDTPRLPDEVSEPDDDFRRRTHHTIHEAESIVDDIVEISEEDELFSKRTEVDRVNESDECLLSVNDKVSKFSNKTGKIPKPKETTAQFKDTERRVHSDYIDETLKSDECLLSVSEKVNKFAKGPSGTKEKSPSRRIVDEYDVNTVYQDDYTKLSVNDKAHLFVETAENVKTTKTKPAQRMERPDLSNVDDSLKSDDCLLSVSDKVNKFVKTAEQFLSESQEVEEKEKKIKEQHDRIMRKLVESTDDETYDKKKKNVTEGRDRPDNKTPDHREERLGSFANETESSHAKIKDYASPNLKPTEKAPTVKITTLRSSEAVKKAKALFENIASTTQQTKTSTQSKTTKLTDIGVTKKSPKTDSTTVLHPSLEDCSPNVTDVDVDNEIDAAPHGPNKDRPTSSTPTRGHYPTRVHDDKPRDSPTRLTTQSPEVPSSKSPARHTVETTTVTKTVLSRYPAAQRADSPKLVRPEYEKPDKPHDKIPGYQRPTKTSQIREETKAHEEIEVSSRRGSGKFGVELRRTSVERSTVSSERRRSSVDHHQPCIEDIYDLDLLEQMLEKVVGYEQRRRIRAQIRVAKKMESEHVVDATYTKTTKHTSVSTPKNRSPERHSKVKSPERQPKTTPHKTSSPEHHVKSAPQKTVSPDRGQPKEQTKPVQPVLNGHVREPVKNIIDRRPRPHSPEKTPQKTAPITKSPVRQPSPDKKTRPASPSKTSTPKSKTNRFNEYASAYMKKVGLNETDKIKFSEVKTKKASDIEDHTINRVDKHKTVETKVSMTSMSKSFTERTSSKDTIEIVQVNGKRSPSPEKKRSPERKPQSPISRPQHRTPSPELKKQKSDVGKKETIIKTVYDIEKKIQPKQVQEEKPSWVTNRNLKKITAETRTFSNKKIEADKPKQRAVSPSKVISKPTDVITSSYGPGPLDADGRPLFGIKALRNGATNYQVKGTVIRQEFHSRNGGEPEGTVSVTAYSTEPEDLEKLLHAQGERPSRLHGLAAITTTKKFGGDTGTTLKEAHSKEEHATLEQFTHSDRRVTDRRNERTESRGVERRQERTRGHRTEDTAEKTMKREDRKNVRQSSVKSLTEKYIKSASDTSKCERNAYPKAGLILRTANMKDSVSSDSSAHAGLARTDSEQSLGSLDDNTVVTTTTERVGEDGRRTTTTATTTRSHGHVTRTQERSFLDSSTKVTGVQDILTRMKNADIVIEEGDSSEDAEARALLNKFLGATVLMAGMQGHMTGETVRSSGGKVTSSSCSVQEFDIDQCWDERVLHKLLDECSDYEQRRRLRARIRTLMAEQEACTSAVTDALAAAGEATDADATEANEARGESLLLPLLQGLLGGGGERLLAGLGAAGADVVADVRRSLGRLRAALEPSANPPHPQARALLSLADRLEDALDAADRLDGCKKRPRRRSRAARHTVGVTHEELAEARRLVDRDQLALTTEATEPPTPPPAAPRPSAAPGPPVEPPTPQRKESVDEEVSYHNAVAARQKPAPVAHSVSYENAHEVNRDARVVERDARVVERDARVVERDARVVEGDARVVERRAPAPRKPDFYRHSVADTVPQPQQRRPLPPPQPRMERRPSDGRSGIAAIANKFNAQIEKEMMPMKRAPVSQPMVTAPTVQQKPTPREEAKRAPLYRPPPPTYNFAAPQAVEEKALNRFNNNKRSRMKRANTIDIGRQFSGYRVDSDTDDETAGPQRGPLVPEFRPQTENDRKFLAFMQKNEESRGAVNGQANWSNRFGNIKNTFENREREDHSRSSSASSSAKRFWQATDEPSPMSAQRPPRRPFAEVNAERERARVPWAPERREPAPTHMPPQMPPQMQPPPPTSVLHQNHPPVPQSPTKPIVVKPFVAKPIPVNQFSHAPMSAFKPPKKIVSPTSAPPLVWSPPSANLTSPTVEHPPSYTISPKPITPSPPVSGVPWAAADGDKTKRDHRLAGGKFDSGQRAAPPSLVTPPHREGPFGYDPPARPTYAPPQIQAYPVKAIPSQSDLAAPQLVKRMHDAKSYGPQPSIPKIDAQKSQIEFYERQIREKNRRGSLENGHREPPAPSAPPARPPQPTYTVTDYTPADVSTFVPLQRTPDIEKTNVHKVDYLPDVVTNESDRRARRVSPADRDASDRRGPYSPATNGPAAYRNGDAFYANGAPEGEATEHSSVVTRVMRGPVCGAATISTGVRTRADPQPQHQQHHQPQQRNGAAESLKGVLGKFSSPKHEVIAQIEKKKLENARNQVRRAAPPPVQNGHGPSPPRPPPSHAPAGPLPPAARPLGSPRSPGPAPAPSAESAGAGGLARSESWHRIVPQTRKPTSPRKVVARAESMNLLTVPKLFEGGIAREELTEKKRTVEAYFSGRAANGGGGRARTARPPPSHAFSLGRSRTMPTVSEMQFLDESNADDAFEDLVSTLA